MEINFKGKIYKLQYAPVSVEKAYGGTEYYAPAENSRGERIAVFWNKKNLKNPSRINDFQKITWA